MKGHWCFSGLLQSARALKPRLHFRATPTSQNPISNRYIEPSPALHLIISDLLHSCHNMQEKICCYFKAPKICSYPDEQDLVSEPVASLRQILDGKLLCAVTGRVVLVHTILQITRDCEKNPLICKMMYELSALSSGPEDVPLVICLRGKIVPMWSMSLNNSCWSHSTNYKLNCVITGSERRQMLNLII